MSKYDSIWGEIKEKGYVEITVSKEGSRTIEQGVLRVKTAENTARRMAGLIGWSKLVIYRTSLSPTRLKIRFSLLYRTDL